MTDDNGIECGFDLLGSCGRATLKMSEKIAVAYDYMPPCQRI